jgi:hypothetical protein
MLLELLMTVVAMEGVAGGVWAVQNAKYKCR